MKDAGAENSQRELAGCVEDRLLQQRALRKALGASLTRDVRGKERTRQPGEPNNTKKTTTRLSLVLASLVLSTPIAKPLRPVRALISRKFLLQLVHLRAHAVVFPRQSRRLPAADPPSCLAVTIATPSAEPTTPKVAQTGAKSAAPPKLASAWPPRWPSPSWPPSVPPPPAFPAPPAQPLPRVLGPAAPYAHAATPSPAPAPPPPSQASRPTPGPHCMVRQALGS